MSFTTIVRPRRRAFDKPPAQRPVTPRPPGAARPILHLKTSSTA